MHGGDIWRKASKEFILGLFHIMGCEEGKKEREETHLTREGPVWLWIWNKGYRGRNIKEETKKKPRGSATRVWREPHIRQKKIRLLQEEEEAHCEAHIQSDFWVWAVSWRQRANRANKGSSSLGVEQCFGCSKSLGGLLSCPLIPLKFLLLIYGSWCYLDNL